MAKSIDTNSASINSVFTLTFFLFITPIKSYPLIGLFLLWLRLEGDKQNPEYSYGLSTGSSVKNCDSGENFDFPRLLVSASRLPDVVTMSVDTTMAMVEAIVIEEIKPGTLGLVSFCGEIREAQCLSGETLSCGAAVDVVGHEETVLLVVSRVPYWLC